MAKSKYKKTSAGYYYAAIKTGIFKEDGKEIIEHVYAKSIAEFERKKDVAKSKILTGTYANDKDITFAVYKKRWYETFIETSALAHGTKKGYLSILNNHTSHLDPISLGDIKVSDVQLGYNRLSGKPNPQARYRLVVRKILRAAMNDYLISRNPADEIQITKQRKKKKRALTELEKKAIPKAEFTLQEKAFVYTLLYTGMRRQEILALTMSNIDLDKDEISITNGLSFEGNKPVVSHTKTEGSDRTVHILKPLKSILADYMNHTNSFILFPNSDGAYMSKTYYKRFYERIYRKINVAAGGSYRTVKDERGRSKQICIIDMCKGLTAYTFRHEYATTLYYSGIDLMEACRLMGHANTRMLTDVYAELQKKESNSKSKLDAYVLERYA